MSLNGGTGGDGGVYRKEISLNDHHSYAVIDVCPVSYQLFRELCYGGQCLGFFSGRTYLSIIEQTYSRIIPPTSEEVKPADRNFQSTVRLDIGRGRELLKQHLCCCCITPRTI